MGDVEVKRFKESLSNVLGYASMYNDEKNLPSFLQNLCRQGAILDENGERYPQSLIDDPAKLEDTLAMSLYQNKDLYIYGPKDNYPKVMRRAPYSNNFKVSFSTGNLAQDTPPQPVPKPGFWARVLDFILKPINRGIVSCMKYDEYQADVKAYEKRQQMHISEKFEVNRSSRDRQLRSNVNTGSAVDKINAEYEAAKEAFHFDKIRDAFAASSDKRTVEQKRTIQIFDRVMNTPEPSLHERLMVLEKADIKKIEAREEAEKFFSPAAPDAEKIKELRGKCSSSLLTSMENIALIVSPDKDAAHDKYMQFLTSAANVATKENPQTLADDIKFLRGIMAENIGSMNGKLLAAGFEDSTVVAANQNSVAALGRVSADVHAKAEASFLLGKFMLAKGENDPMMVSMTDRAGTIASFVKKGDSATRSPQRMKEVFENLSSFGNELAGNRRSFFHAYSEARDNVEAMRFCDAEAAKVNVTAAKWENAPQQNSTSIMDAPVRAIQEVKQSPEQQQPKPQPKPAGPMM